MWYAFLITNWTPFKIEWLFICEAECRGDKFYSLLSLHSLNNCSPYKSWANRLHRSVSSSSHFHPGAAALISQPQLCKSKFIISLSNSDRLSGRRSRSLKCRKAFPLAALPCLPAGLQSEFTATVKTSVGSQRGEGVVTDREWEHGRGI